MMATRQWVRVAAASFSLALCALLALQAQRGDGQTKPAVTPPERLGPADRKTPKERDEIRIQHADKIRYDTKIKLSKMYGDVQFQNEDITVVCDEAMYNEVDDTATCAGHLKLTDPDSVITGEFLAADFAAEIAKVTGKVTVITTKPKKDESGKETGEKQVTTITCDRLDYYYTEGKRRAHVTGNIKAVQEDKTVFAQTADYDREKDIIVLGDDVTIKMDNGNEMRCKKATIAVAEDWVEMEGKIEGKINREKKKGEEKPKP